MSLLNNVKLSFILEGPNVIGTHPVTMSLEASRIDCQTLTRFIDAACENLNVTVKKPDSVQVQDLPRKSDPAAGPVQVLRNPGTVPSEMSAAAAKKVKVKKEKKPGTLLQCPYCDRSIDTRTLHYHIRKRHSERYDKSSVSRYILGGGGLTDYKKTLETVSPTMIVTGMKVRQIKPDHGTQFQGVGTVTARVGGLFEVDLGNGMKKKVDAACLGVA